MTVIREIVQIFKNYQFDTNVLVASVRHPLHVSTRADRGARSHATARHTWQDAQSSVDGQGALRVSERLGKGQEGKSQPYDLRSLITFFGISCSLLTEMAFS